MKALILISLILFMLFSGAAKADERLACTSVSDCFDIPEEYVLTIGEPGWEAYNEGETAAVFLLPLDASNKSCEADDFWVLMQYVGLETFAETIAPTEAQKDMWYAQGAYEDRLVEKIEGTDYYAVHVDASDRLLWNVFNQYPDKDKPIPNSMLDYHVAACSALGHCQLIPVYENTFVMRMDMPYACIGDVEDIKAQVYATLDSWRIDK